MASSPRFQSHLFRFVVQQSRHWLDSGDRLKRHILLGIVWGLQVMLYPLYVAVQAGRSLGTLWGSRSLESNFLKSNSLESNQQVLSSEKGSSAWGERSESEPISEFDPTSTLEQLFLEKILQKARAIAHFSPSDDSIYTPLPSSLTKISQTKSQAQSQTKSQTKLSPTETPQIRGIATALSSQQLVLVTEQNEVLDVLSSTQQHQLLSHIENFLNPFSSLAHEPSPPKVPLNSARDLTHWQLPSVIPHWLSRCLQQLMVWEQRSEVALALNFFRESIYLRTVPPEWWGKSLSTWNSFLPKGLPEGLPEGLPKDLPEDGLGNFPEPLPLLPPFPWWKPVDQTIARLEQFLLGNFDPSQNPSSPNLESNREPNLEPETPVQPPPSPLAHPPNIQPDTSPKTKSAKQWAIAPKSPLTSNQRSHQRQIDTLDPPKKTILSGPPSAPPPTPTPHPEDTWIEAESEPIGYAQHPLERILTGLDQLMVWLENLLLKLWSWLRGQPKS